MQLKKRKHGRQLKQIGAPLAAATCALLGQAPGDVKAQELAPWDIDTSLLIYSEADSRVQDLSLNAIARKELREDSFLNLTLALDTLTGASPSGAAPSSVPQTFTRPSGNASYTVPANEPPLDDTFQDTRTALSASWEWPVTRLMLLNVGASLSDEYDYTHTGLNAKLARDFNNRNTTLSFGLALANDTIDPVGGSPVPLAPMLEQGNSANKRGSESKDVTDFLLGVTQVLNRKTLVQLNYSLSNSDGYLTDPYKVLSVVDPVTGSLVPGPVGSGLYRYLYESRPDTREKQSLFGLIKRDMGGNVLEVGYSLARTNIHSCDFSSGSYTYVDEGDTDLKSFSIAHDQQYKIPLISKAIEAAGNKLVLFASPWSPPAFMKDNKDILHGGKLLPEYYQSWANYYVKFVRSYEKEGILVWGISVQNEPMATQTWESCIYTAEEERDFLKNFLGPTLKKEGLGDKKIIVWDHNRDLMNYRANVIFSDPEASKYAWGMGFHWYEPWTGGQPMFTNVGKVHEAWPDKNLIFTEGCADSFNKERYYHWPNGEKYGSSMINDFNNGTCGWTDWNILLDEQGGPNHVGNFCFAPVHYDTQTGQMIYTPSYYYIGHFSKFIRPGAKMVNTVASRSALGSTSFLNPDGKIATVVMNQSGKAIQYKLFAGNFMATISIPAHAIQTIIY